MTDIGADVQAAHVPTVSLPSARRRRFTGAIGGMLTIGLAAFLVVREPWHGQTLLASTPTHGVDSGDLVVLALLALALVFLRIGTDSSVFGSARTSMGPWSVALLGSLLLCAGLRGLTPEGALLPTGGATTFDNLLVASVVIAACWLGIELVRGRGRWMGVRHGSWRTALGLLLIGCLLDTAFTPSGTMFGVVLLAVWFGRTASSRVEAIAGRFMAAFLGLTSVVALLDVGDLGGPMARSDGGVARVGALGGFLTVVGLLRCHYATADGAPAPMHEPIR